MNPKPDHRARRQARVQRDARVRRHYRESKRNRIPVPPERETNDTGNR